MPCEYRESYNQLHKNYSRGYRFHLLCEMNVSHYNDVTMSAMASQITSSFIVCSTVCSGADQRKHQSSVPLAFVKGIHRWPVDSPHKGPVTRKMFLFDDVIMLFQGLFNAAYIWYKNYTHGWRFIALNVGLYRSIYPYISGLLHWHWGNHMIAPVPVKQTWRIWVNAYE